MAWQWHLASFVTSNLILIKTEFPISASASYSEQEIKALWMRSGNQTWKNSIDSADLIFTLLWEYDHRKLWQWYGGNSTMRCFCPEFKPYSLHGTLLFSISILLYVSWIHESKHIFDLYPHTLIFPNQNWSTFCTNLTKSWSLVLNVLSFHKTAEIQNQRRRNPTHTLFPFSNSNFM